MKLRIQHWYMAKASQVFILSEKSPKKKIKNHPTNQIHLNELFKFVLSFNLLMFEFFLFNKCYYLFFS